MWIVIIIIGIVILFFVLASKGSNDQVYKVYNQKGDCVYMGTAKSCADYIELCRLNGSNERFKTKRYK